MTETQSTSGILESLKSNDKGEKFKIGGKITIAAFVAGPNACQTPQAEIQGFYGKLVRVEYVDNQQGKYTYHNATKVEAVAESEKAVVLNGMMDSQKFQRWQSCEVTAREIMCALINAQEKRALDTKSVIECFRELYSVLRKEVDGEHSTKDAYTSPSEEGERSPEDVKQSQDTLILQIMGEMVTKRSWNETVCKSTLIDIAKEQKWTIKGAKAQDVLGNWDAGQLAIVLTQAKQYPIIGSSFQGRIGEEEL